MCRCVATGRLTCGNAAAQAAVDPEDVAQAANRFAHAGEQIAHYQHVRRDVMLELHAAGLSTRQIADALGIRQPSVWEAIKKAREQPGASR